MLPQSTTFHLWQRSIFFIFNYQKKIRIIEFGRSLHSYGIEVPLNDKKVLVLCAIDAERAFWPHFFEKSVNQHKKLKMLKTFWSKLRKVRTYSNVNGIWKEKIAGTHINANIWIKEHALSIILGMVLYRPLVQSLTR